MGKLAELREKRASLVTKAQGIRAVATTANRVNTPEELTEINTTLDAVDSVTTEIKNLEKSAEAIDERLGNVSQFINENRGRRTTPDDVSNITTKDLLMNDPKKGFKTPRAFMTAVMMAGRPGGGKISENLKMMAASLHARNQRDLDSIMATAGSDEAGGYSDPYGGFFIPEGFSPELLRVDPEADPMAGRTRMLPMSSPTVKFNARVDKDHTKSVSGGLVVSRSAETIQKASARMKFEQVVLEANTLFGAAYATEELLQDSPTSFAALIAAGFSDEFTNQVIKERLRGTGAGEMMGILNSPCLVTVAKESAQANTTIVANNIYKMRARIWGYKDAIWMANQDIIPQLATLNVQVSTAGGSLVYLPSAREDMPDMLLGRPIIYSEYMSTLGAVGDLGLFNWSQYLEGIYQPMQSAESIHVRFLNHERCFKFWMRNGGAPWWMSPLTPVQSANTMSPFIVLAGRP